MNAGAWSEFFAMGGYGLYVWGSFGVTAALMALEIVLLRQRRRGLQIQLGRLKRGERT